MDTSTFRTAFPRQLRFWTFHCIINALPSFCIALMLLGLWKSPSGIVAMSFGIATYIVLYASLTSLIGPLSNEGGLFSRSLKTGAKTRSVLAAIALITFFLNLCVFKMSIGSQAEKAVSIGYVTDLYCGFAANQILEDLVHVIKPLVLKFSFGTGTIGFLKIYLITVIEGFILSFLLLMISFFAVIFLQARDRKRVFAVADPG